jgi:hypothetical protein
VRKHVAPRVASVPDQPAVPQRRWLALAQDVVDAAWLREDARRRVLVIARAIGWSADWHTGRSRPTMARLVEVSGLSLRTVQRWCRWLENAGLLVVTEPGTTPDFRPGILNGCGSNLAREWQLVDPAVTPSQENLDLPGTCKPYAGARAGTPRSDAASRRLPDVPQTAPWARWRNPKTRSEALTAAAVVRSASPFHRRLSERHWRSIARVFVASGWAPGDILHALDHLPDGSQHWHTAPVVNMAAWARHRLSLWLNDEGHPVLALSQRRAIEREQLQAEQAARRAARHRAVERRGDYPGWAAAARAMMAARPGVSHGGSVAARQRHSVS